MLARQSHWGELHWVLRPWRERHLYIRASHWTGFVFASSRFERSHAVGPSNFIVKRRPLRHRQYALPVCSVAETSWRATEICLAYRGEVGGLQGSLAGLHQWALRIVPLALTGHLAGRHLVVL